jgi:hypothetical protein
MEEAESLMEDERKAKKLANSTLEGLKGLTPFSEHQLDHRFQ